MAICHECGEEFFGYKCWCCGWITQYICWNCKTKFIAEDEILCGQCKWFICPSCGECGCNPERPESMKEREDRIMWEEKARIEKENKLKKEDEENEKLFLKEMRELDEWAIKKLKGESNG